MNRLLAQIWHLEGKCLTDTVGFRTDLGRHGQEHDQQ